jgi:hypothetical protein
MGTGVGVGTIISTVLGAGGAAAGIIQSNKANAARRQG